MQISIDCSAIQTREDLHRIFAEGLDFPSWYGNNLDALHDQLTSLSGIVRLEHWSTAETALGKYGHAAKKVMAHAALENERLLLIFS